MFGKFTVNSHDWLAIQDYFKELCPQLVEHYMESKPDKPWLQRDLQKSMKVYSAVYNLCTAPQPRNERIYAFYQKILEQFVILCETKSVEKQERSNLLQKQAKQWEGYCQLARICKRTFQYLDRYYVVQSNLQCVSDKALSTYEEVHLNSRMVTSLVGEVINNVRESRENLRFESDIVLKISTMIRDVSAVTGSESYQQLSKAVQQATRAYYNIRYQSWQQLTPETYINNAFRLLSFQQKAFKLILPGEDSQVLNPIFESEIVHKYLPVLEKHEQGLKLFFLQEKIEFLNKIYHLFLIYRCTDELKRFYHNYFRNVGFELFSNLRTEQDSEKVLRAFSNFYLHTQSITSSIFSSSAQFLIQFRKVMEMIIHIHDEEFNLAWKMVDYINHYFTSNAHHHTLQPVLIIFDCMTNKDIFIEAYESDLTARLVNGQCPYLQEEQNFIAEIRQKCGENFTESIDGKMSDYMAAMALNKEFLRLNAQLAHSFSVKVLSKKYWIVENKPNIEYFPFNIVWPKELVPIKTSFENFYNERNMNRHIQHLPLLSTVLVDIKCKDGQTVHNYETKLSLLQATLLIHIQQSPIEVSESEIHSKFELNPEILNSQIKILTQGSNPLLLRGQTGYKFNQFFNPLKGELNVEVPNLRKNSKSEASSVDRELAIQGAIVKILKSKGKSQLYGLIEEVEARLKFFKPSISKIKQALQRLIEKEFIERCEGETNVFSYKA